VFRLKKGGISAFTDNPNQQLLMKTRLTINCIYPVEERSILLFNTDSPLLSFKFVI